MKKLLICLLIAIMSLSCVFTCEAKKEFFNFVEIEKTLTNYFSYLESGNRENLLSVIDGTYYDMVINGELDNQLDEIKQLGKHTALKVNDIRISDKDENKILYIIFMLHGEVFTKNEVVIEEIDNVVKIIDHYIIAIKPKNK